MSRPQADTHGWRDVLARGPVAAGRPIDWPRPYPLKGGDPVEHALTQRAEGYLADKGFERVPVTLPFDWTMSPFASRPWRTRLMCLQPMDAPLYAWRETGDAAWLRDAADIFFDWWARDGGTGASGFRAWADMPVGYRAMKIALTTDAAAAGEWSPSEAEGAALMAAAEAHLGALMEPERLSDGNHGIFQLHGLRVLSEVTGLRRADADAFLTEHLTRLIDRQFGEEGVHLEHSPHYHWWMQSELAAIRDSGWHGTLDLDARLARAEEAKHWMLAPGELMVRVGDTPDSEPVLPPAVPARPDHVEGGLSLRWFPSSGIAAAKTDDALVFFHAAYHSKSHKHADDLHVELHDLGRPILVDAGSSGYKTGPARSYAVSTHAHNTVEWAGRSYPRDGTDAYGSGLVGAGLVRGGAYLEGRVRHASAGVSHRRRAVFLPGRALVLQDRLRAGEEAEAIQWLHLAPRWRPVGDPADLTFTDGEAFVRIEPEADAAVRAHNAMEGRDGEPDWRQGWRTLRRDLEPSWSIGLAKRGRAPAFRTAVRYALDAPPALDDLSAATEPVRDLFRAEDAP